MGISKLMKLISIILITFIILISCNNNVFARLPDDDYKAERESKKTQISGDVIDDPGNFKPTEAGKGTETKFEEKIETILGAINIVGIVVSVMTLMIIGIKYMLGSIEEKAEYKKTMITYFVGAFLIFAVTTLPNIFYKMGEFITNI